MRVYEVKSEVKIGDEIKTVTYWNVHVSESLSLQERDQIDTALEVFRVPLWSVLEFLVLARWCGQECDMLALGNCPSYDLSRSIAFRIVI